MLSRNDVVASRAPEGDPAEVRDWLRARWIVALAGLLSGLAAYGIGEATYNVIPARKVMLNTMGTIAPAVTPTNQSVANVRNGAIAAGVLGLCLGGGLGIAGGLSRRSLHATVTAGLLGSILGAAWPASVALGLLKPFADALVNYSDYDIFISMAMHGLIWGLAGAVGGLAFAVGLGRRRMLARAALAGLAGAILGAIAFDVVGAYFFPLADTGEMVSLTWPSRLVARLWVTAAAAACVAMVLPGPRSHELKTLSTPGRAE